ncbi:unnamed protein product [Larinioides sclopetarius]|uniref:G-protein coupled receptors family 1 profile domain-containing protein n=1 Tax=Larinioides sclopetarius TaxID=280406 RepID=A0AAV2AE08_9ARAC
MTFKLNMSNLHDPPTEDITVDDLICRIRLNFGLSCNLSVTNSSYCDNDEMVNDSTIANAVENWTSHHYEELQEDANFRNAIVIFFYTLIIFVSFFGNLIVCKIVFTGSGKKSTTNLYIGNLSISDLMMTIINIPLQLIEVLIRNWPLGFFLCKCLHIFGGMSVATSTLTMAFIALDRYQVIAHPLKPRPSYKTTIYKIAFIWIAAFILSFPYSLMSHITNPLSYDNLTRCTVQYPCPDFLYRQIFTLIAFVLQFAGPLTVSIIIYAKICLIVWRRKSIGVVTVDQQIYQQEAKWKTIKMLIIVLIVFIVCWLPLNIYHTYQDFRGETGFKKHNSVVWFICHWFAMSSVCFNPFIYCWLNEKFRKIARTHLQWILIGKRTRYQKPDLVRNCEMRLTVSTNIDSSVKFSAFDSQSKEFSTVGYEEQISLQTASNGENSVKTTTHSIITKTTEDEICIGKQFTEQNNLINMYYLSDEKKYKNSTSETFV